MSGEEQKPGFWRRYRRYFLISFVLYIVLMGHLYGGVHVAQGQRNE